VRAGVRSVVVGDPFGRRGASLFAGRAVVDDQPSVAAKSSLEP
jgi:hypothetical protein